MVYDGDLDFPSFGENKEIREINNMESIMSELFNEGTAKYFEEKFENINNKIDGIISSLSKKGERVDKLITSVTILETYKKEHDKVHENMIGKNQSNKGYWLLFIFCLITALTNIIIAVV